MQNCRLCFKCSTFLMFNLFVFGCKYMKYCFLFSQQSFYLFVSQNCKTHVKLERGRKYVFVNLSGFSIKYFTSFQRLRKYTSIFLQTTNREQL